MRLALIVAAVAMLACLGCVAAAPYTGEWIQPAFIEADGDAVVDPNDPGPAAHVAWEKPKPENINHQDHRRVHVTLLASHLDQAHEHNRLGNGVQVIDHTDAADKHNTAAELHRKADADPDFIEPAVKASAAAYRKTRSLIRRIKPNNMIPLAEQPNAKATAAVQELAKMVAPAIAPESLEERQYRRLIGKD